MPDTVIRVENLSKAYRLGVINHGMLYKDVQSWWARFRGKEDPNSVIGMYNKEQMDGDDRFWALKDINFEVKQGDRIGIIGKNGAGKSTLLKILSRVTAPTRGNILVKGRIASLLEVGTGFHPELTGRENVYLNGAILGMSKKEIGKKFNEIVDFSGVEKFIDTPVKRYSSGMYVRLAFAVAAHLKPEILVVDEVLAVGDAEFQKKAIGKMEDVSKGKGRTILFVSHNMGAIEQLCNKIMILKNGNMLLFDENIEKGIEQYLHNNLKGGSLDDENTIYEYENLTILNFRFVDKNGRVTDGNISNDKTIYIEIEFDLRRLDTAFNIGYALFGGGNLYYWTLSTDCSQYEWPEFVIGTNVIRSAVPTHLLNEGDYVIKLYASLHFIKAVINPYHDESPSLYLSIQGGLSKSPYWYNRRPGLCAPVIKWEKIQ